MCEPSAAQRCHTCRDPTREGSSSALSQESSQCSSGWSGSCAKAGRETPQPRLEELPAAGVGRAANVPWFGGAQLIPEGLNYLKTPAMPGKGGGEMVGHGANLQGAVVEVGEGLEHFDGIFLIPTLAGDLCRQPWGWRCLFIEIFWVSTVESITEPWNGLGWKGPESSSSSDPLERDDPNPVQPGLEGDRSVGKRSGGLSSLSLCRDIPKLEHRETGAGLLAPAGRQAHPKAFPALSSLRALRGTRGKGRSSRAQAAGFSHFYCKALGRANYNGVGHLTAQQTNGTGENGKGITTVSCSRLRTERVTRESICAHSARGEPSPRPEGFPAQGNASHIEQYNLSKRRRLRRRAPSEK